PFSNSWDAPRFGPLPTPASWGEEEDNAKSSRTATKSRDTDGLQICATRRSRNGRSRYALPAQSIFTARVCRPGNRTSRHAGTGFPFALGEWREYRVEPA